MARNHLLFSPFLSFRLEKAEKPQNMMNCIIKLKNRLFQVFSRDKTGVKTPIENSAENSNTKEYNIPSLKIEFESDSQLIISTLEPASEVHSNDVSEKEAETDPPPVSTAGSNGLISIGNETTNLGTENSLSEEVALKPGSVISVSLDHMAMSSSTVDTVQSVHTPITINSDTVNIYLPGKCDTSVDFDVSPNEEPGKSFVSNTDKVPILNEEKIPREQAERLVEKNLLIKINGAKAYYVNPLLACFFHITDIESLNALDSFDDENICVYQNIARFFHFDNNGELVFDADGKLGMLEIYLSRISPKYESRAARVIEETYGKDVHFESLETQTDEKGLKWDRLVLNVRSSSARCPCCGQTTSFQVKESGSSSRKVQDIPMHINRRLMVEFHGLRQYRCQNPDCTKCRNQEAFIEQPDCLRPNQQRTKRLDALLLVCVIDASFHGCERVMDLYGIKVGDDSVRRIVKSLVFPDDKDVTAIGVDDVADRKGVSYFTVIYSLKDHRMLALLEGRDGVELEKWLDNHLSVNLICRDRASAYAVHIDEWARRHNVTVSQVADRFHLVKNYIDHLRDICCSYLPRAIAFDKKTGEILPSVPNKIAQAIIPKPDDNKLQELNYDNSPVLDEKGEPIPIILSAGSSSSEKDAEDSTDETEETASDTTTTGRKKVRRQSKVEKEAQEKREKRYDIVRKIRLEFDPSGAKMEQYKALGAKYNVSPQTVSKYVSMSPEAVESLKFPKHREKGPLSKEIDKFKYIIYKMMKDGYDVDMIFWYIKSQGYEKSDSNLINYILDIYRIVFPERIQPRISRYIKLTYPDNVEVLTRSAILKYLVTVNPRTPKNQYLTAHEEEFLKKYPKAKLIRDAFLEFHGVIMGDSVEDLEKLCSKPCALPELESFFHHLLNEDMEAVSNAIRYSYSSGFVEGNNLRFKTTKRASYGRMRLAMLVQKCMTAFCSTLEDFELGMVVDWIPLRDNPNYTADELDNYLNSLQA